MQNYYLYLHCQQNHNSVYTLSDLFTPIVEFALGIEMSSTESWAVTAMLLSIVFPFCLMKSMSQLKFISMVSVFSMGLLAFAVGVRSIESFPPKSVVYFSGNLEDILYSFPIILVAFICHFNVLPMHSELIDPTRSRIQAVFHICIAVCCTLYVAVVGRTLPSWNLFFGYLCCTLCFFFSLVTYSHYQTSCRGHLDTCSSLTKIGGACVPTSSKTMHTMTFSSPSEGALSLPRTNCR